MPFPNSDVHLITDFGGLQSVTAAGDCPPGTAADAKNVMYYPGAVRHRDGFSTYHTDDEGGILYWDEFITPDGTNYKILFYDTGAIKLQTGEGASTFLVQGKNATDGTFVSATKPRATTFLGRSFMALGDGSKGTELMRQYSPTLGSLFPVAPDGPGVAPTMHIGYPDASGVDLPDGQVTDGTSSVNFVVIFITKTGFATAPSPPCTAVPAASATGKGTMYLLDNIAVGPSYVTERWIFMTPSTGGGLNDYYHMEGGLMQIKDNTTTSVGPFGYSDGILVASGKKLIEVMAPPLAEHAGVTSFNERLVVWGGRSALQNILSSKTSFATGDASGKGYMQGPIGWRLEGGNDGTFPNGWYGDVPAGYTAASGFLQTSATAVGDCWRFKGTGTAADTGALTSGTTVVTGVDGVTSPFLAGLTYQYRIRLRRSADATGILKVSIGGGEWDIDIAADVGTDWTLIEGGEGAVMNPTIKVDTANPLPTDEWVDFDRLHAFEKGFPNERSTIRVSRIQDPESFVEVQEAGLIPISPDDGQEVRAVVPFRGNLYVFKDRSMWAVIDNGGEPGDWSRNLVSSQVGVDSARAVVAGDGFLVIINRNGLYLFQGGQPVKISTEIDGTWRASAFGAASFGVVDSERQHLLATPGAGASTEIATYCDFFEGLPQAGTYTQGHGRKYANWDLAANPKASPPVFGSLLTRTSGQRDIVIGKHMVSSNECVRSETGTFDGGAAFSGSTGWFNVEVGSTPVLTGATDDPLGTLNGWRWDEDGSPEHRRVIAGWDAPDATHAFGAIWIKNAGLAEFNVTLGLRSYDGGEFTDTVLAARTRTIRVTSEWQRFAISTVNTGGALPAGYICLYLSIPASVSMYMYGPQLIKNGYDLGYVRASSGPVADVATTLIQALSRTTYQQIQPSLLVVQAPELTFDSDNYIDSFYVGAPVGRQRERGGFLGCVMKVWGVGTLRSTVYKLYPVGARAIADRTLPGPLATDIEVKYGGNINDSGRAGLAFESWQANWKLGVDSDPLAYWNLSSINIYERQANAPFLGA